MLLAMAAVLLPHRCGVLLSFVLAIVNMTQVSLIGGIIGGVFLVILYITIARLFPDHVYMLLLVPLCINLKMYLLVPLFAGLFVGSIAIVPIIGGTLLWGFIQVLPKFLEMEQAALDALPKMISDVVVYSLEQIFRNETLIFLVFVFSGVVLLVNLLNKISMDYIQYISIAVGMVMGMVCLIAVSYTHLWNISMRCCQRTNMLPLPLLSQPTMRQSVALARSVREISIIVPPSSAIILRKAIGDKGS